MATDKKTTKRTRRHARIRAKIIGTKEMPRLSVFRSNKHIYAQLIDDEKSVTLLSAHDNDKDLPKLSSEKTGSSKEFAGVSLAYRVGMLIALRAKEKKIARAVFDRGGFLYKGQVRAVAEGAREGGLSI
jgi:large subunit ribosomal protein L18